MISRMLSILAVGALVCVTLCAADVSAEDQGFDVTDGTGRTFHFDGAAEHIVLNGSGAALTVADAGAVDKIVAVDKYSTYGYTGYEQLRDLDAIDLGGFYGTTNHDYIFTTLLQMVGSGALSLDDPIILTVYPSNETLRTLLEGAGFTHVLVWTTESVEEYDDIVGFVRDVTMIAMGEEAGSLRHMQEVIDLVTDAVSSVPDEERTKALAVWYSSSSGLMVNNIGIASSMLELCNAVNIGYVEDGGTRYGDANTVIALLGENPGTVIFLPSSWETAGLTVEDFRDDYLGGSTDFVIVQMGALWNNYCPESADGLLAMAQALYPELLPSGDGGEGAPAEDPTGDGGDAVMWVAALAVAVVVLVVAYAAFKRTHG